jgi:hypothetical protein
MTLPYEEAMAIANARLFLLSLLDRKMTKRIPLAIRREARYRLKHFPNGYTLRELLKSRYGEETADNVMKSYDAGWASMYKMAHGVEWRDIGNSVDYEDSKDGISGEN